MTTAEWKRKQPGRVWQIGPGVYATPYGWVEITRGGKSISFNLFANMKASTHDKSLLSVVMQLYRAGITEINADHLNLPFLDQGLDLRRLNRTLDLVFIANGKLHECELATRRQVGLDSTWAKIRDLLGSCKNLEVWIPKAEQTNAHEILTITGLYGKLDLVTYEEVL